MKLHCADGPATLQLGRRKHAYVKTQTLILKLYLNNPNAHQLLHKQTLLIQTTKQKEEQSMDTTMWLNFERINNTERIETRRYILQDSNQMTDLNTSRLSLGWGMETF